MEVVVMPSPWRWSHSPAMFTTSLLLKAVAGEPIFVPLLAIPVEPAAFSFCLALASVSVKAVEAVLRKPCIVAVIIKEVSKPAPIRFVVKLVAADPVVITPVVVGLWGVPPAAVIVLNSAKVLLVVGIFALLPYPFAVAVVVLIVFDAGGSSADREKGESKFHHFDFLFFYYYNAQNFWPFICS